MTSWWLFVSFLADFFPSSVLEAGVPDHGSGSDPGRVFGSDPPAVPHSGVEDAALGHFLLGRGVRHRPCLPLGLAQRRLSLRDRPGPYGRFNNPLWVRLRCDKKKVSLWKGFCLCRCFFLESWSCIWSLHQPSCSTSVKFPSATSQVKHLALCVHQSLHTITGSWLVGRYWFIYHVEAALTWTWTRA